MDDMLNGRQATDWELAAIDHARKCEQERDMGLLAGLLSEYPRGPVLSSPPMSVLSLPALP